MAKTLEYWLNRLSPTAKRASLGTRIKNLEAAMAARDLKNAFILTAPTLVIKAGGGTVVKSSTAFSALVGGLVQSKSANQDMSAIAGTLATAKFAAWAFEMDNAGTISTTTKTADVATEALALAALPARTANKVRLGHIVVGNATGSDFTAGTTALDATGVTTTYYSATAETAYPVLESL